jgi:putative glutathione S-transferase
MGMKAEFPRETGRKGEFVRQPSAFRDWVTADGSSGFAAEAGRYHLYVSFACPWAHRTIIYRKLKALESTIGLTVADPIRDVRGWAFTDTPGCGPDLVNGFRFLSQAYHTADPSFDGRVTVPVLWDKRKRCIVNNESADIIRMFNSEFGSGGTADLDFYPRPLRAEIDAVNEEVYSNVNDGVYRCGFATTQSAYDDAFERLFATLDRLERRLAGQRYLVGDTLTEADWRLFTTLVRFDPVYYGHFPTSGTTRASSIRFPALPIRSIWITSNDTTTSRTGQSIRPVWFREGPRSISMSRTGEDKTRRAGSRTGREETQMAGGTESENVLPLVELRHVTKGYVAKSSCFSAAAALANPPCST